MGAAAGGMRAAYVLVRFLVQCMVSTQTQHLTSLQFVEYDQRAHRLYTLASFSFFVASECSNLLVRLPKDANRASYMTDASPFMSQPSSPPPALLSVPPRPRVASAQSVESRMSAAEQEEPTSPVAVSHEASNGLSPAPAAMSVSKEHIKVDLSCPRPEDNNSIADDGPVFRATMKALEQKTGNMRTQMKRLIKTAAAARDAQVLANEAWTTLMEVLKEVSSTNANAVQPAIEHYFDKIAREILDYERINASNLNKIVIEPLTKVYQLDIKQAEAKKREFEEESKDFYSYVSRYLGQRQDSVKAKQSDTKYQTKRKNFELKRFDYSSFMQDLSGGRKEQEVLSHLTRYADAQARAFLATSKRVDDLLPPLEALFAEIQKADKEYQYQRREREEKRRFLEKSTLSYTEPDPTAAVPGSSAGDTRTGGQVIVDAELGRADNSSSQLRAIPIGVSGNTTSDLSRSPGSLAHSVSGSSPGQNAKFKGVREHEERDSGSAISAQQDSTRRKEGLLWALNRPGGHVDPRNFNKQGWHKYVGPVIFFGGVFSLLTGRRRFWIVLDQGKLSEYSNWKQKLDLHMEPIDLRLASVREARNAERRFCFEVITPQYKRVYQATSEDDMVNWITSINNALQSAMEGHSFPDKQAPSALDSGSKRDERSIGSVFTGKSLSLNYGSHSSTNTTPLRRTTVGSRPATSRGNSFDDPDKLLQMLRDKDPENATCADCGSSQDVKWCSINLGIIICIECSGAHRKLTTDVSKVRSLTLDVGSFTPHIIELFMLVGNRISNQVWEARLDPAKKLAPASPEERLEFITNKYVKRLYVQPISTTLSSFQTADETLIAAVKRNDIQQVLYALALRASLNATDKSRGTPALFLALAAADPASPSPAPSPAPSAAAGTPEKVVPFAVAEMLIQNGAKIPDAMPAFPLSRAAQAYLDAKRGRAAANAHAVLVDSYDGNGLAPNHGSATTMGSMAGVGALSPSDRLQREKESRLQKRISAGGRLAKMPIPER